MITLGLPHTVSHCIVMIIKNSRIFVYYVKIHNNKKGMYSR